MSLVARLVIFGIILAAVVTAVLAVVNAYNNAIRRAEKAEALSKTLEKERDGWIEVAAQVAAQKQIDDKILEAREKQRVVLINQRNSAYAEVEELKRQASVKPWADAPIPDLVLKRLRGGGEQTPTPNPKGPPTKSANGGDTSTPIHGTLDWRLAELY